MQSRDGECKRCVAARELSWRCWMGMGSGWVRGGVAVGGVSSAEVVCIAAFRGIVLG